MYRVNAPAVYVEDLVAKNPAYMAKVERVVAALENPVTPIIYGEADLPGMAAKGLWSGRGTMGKKETVPDPVLLFNTFKFDFERQARLDRLVAAGVGVERPSRFDVLLGHCAFNWQNHNQEGHPDRHDNVCRPCWRLHQQQGCLHKCDYCAFYSFSKPWKNEEKFFQTLEKELSELPADFNPETIFIGGGTPTAPDFQTLEIFFPRFGKFSPAEFSVEANPGTVDAARINISPWNGDFKKVA